MCRGIPFILSELFCRFKPAKEPAFLVVTDYDSGDLDWTKTFIPAAQKEWLRQELKKDDLPVVIFIHELLDTFSGIDKELYIGNAEEIVSILEQCGKVIAIIQEDHFSKVWMA